MVKKKPRRGGGNGNGAPKLEEADPEKFQAVKTALEAGKTTAEIIAEHDVSPRTLSRIRVDYADTMPAPRTGRIEERDPEKFQEICKALTAQVPVNIIASELSVAVVTVSRIKREYGAQFPEWKSATSSSLAWNVALLAESMRKDLKEGKLPPTSKALALGICSQNAQLLAGQATSITETRNIPAVKTVNSALDALEIFDAEVVSEETKKN